MKPWGPNEQNDPGGYRSKLWSPGQKGISPTRQRGVLAAECAGCGEISTDWVKYDAGPAPTDEDPGRRCFVHFCVKPHRDKKTQFIDEKAEAGWPDGCATDYVLFVRHEEENGSLDGRFFMHDLVRRFVRSRRPSVTFPDTPRFAASLPKL